MADGGKFVAQITAFVAQTKERMDAVFQESAERVVEEMNKPGYSVASVSKAIEKGIGTRGRGKNKQALQGPVFEPGGGGNVPVDTGFLRASLVVSFDAPTPMDPANKPKEGQTYAFDPATILKIGEAEIGMTIFASYSAIYARAINYGQHGSPGRLFVQLAAQQWPQIVSATCLELQSRVEGSAGGTGVTPST